MEWTKVKWNETVGRHQSYLQDQQRMNPPSDMYAVIGVGLTITVINGDFYETKFKWTVVDIDAHKESYHSRKKTYTDCVLFLNCK